MRPFFKVLLWPLSILYGLIVGFRNHLYNIGYKKSFTFQTMVISVGNLSIGGNGKTPLVEYLIRLLIPHKRVAVLSRGYGRKTNGFRLAKPNDVASDIGDEPMQMYKKFPTNLTVAVGESRALAIPKILLEQPEVETIILDDAFQHRSVKPQLNILATDYWEPFFEDYLLPSGRLRESRQGALRADMVVVTKCPYDISDQDRAKYISKIHEISSDIPVFFTAIQYNDPVHFFSGERLVHEANVLLVSGIANPDTLVRYVSKRYTLLKHMKFGDHFRYGLKDVYSMQAKFDQLHGNNKIILTTEKDMVRLMPYKSVLEKLPIYFIPIQCKFLDQGDEFNEMVLNSFGRVENSKI